MRLYYIDESEGPTCYVRSALGVDAERWNDLSADIQEWRRQLQERHAIPTYREIHACDLLAGRGMLARNDESNARLVPAEGAEVFRAGLRRIEDAAIRIRGVEVINVCLRKPDVKAYEQVSLDRLLNRINASVKAAGRYAFLIFDEGKERMITRAYRRLRIFNPVPSRYERWEEGEKTRNIPVENVIGGPAFRSSDSDHLLQMTDLVAHALLKQEEEPVPRVESHCIHEAFSILDKALNRRASRRDPQGIVRR
ncbi:MAG: DUF3800 domain-containing protein [Chloroflexota bacterium]|nr:DUF3800 domain-containing protein [Chloroflexota bacterium]